LGRDLCEPQRTGGLNRPDLWSSKVFSYTAYDFPGLIAACDRLARQALVGSGGRVETSRGGEVFIIPVKPPARAKPN
jgi:hypothetical protein